MSQNASLVVDEDIAPVRLAGAAFLAVLLCHAVVDSFAALVPAILGLLEVRLSLTAQQSAWLLGWGAFCSGMAQPICAWLSDRRNSRRLGIVGVALGALGISSIGLATGVTSLALLYTVGMVGIGMFHPVGVTTSGHLWVHNRNTSVSLFFVAGMLGGVLGAFFWPRVLAIPSGFRFLPLAIVPATALIVFTARSFALLGPPQESVDKIPTASARRSNWTMVGLLYVAACLRFSVNMALLYLYVRWIQAGVASEHRDWSVDQVARYSAPLVGNMNTATLMGMALGGLAAGFLVRVGREKWPLVWVPITFAPVIGWLPHGSLALGTIWAMLAGVGFAAMIPVTIALAQRLLPHRANLASSMMMGGAWAVAMVGPRLAEFGVTRWGLNTTFLLTALGLILSGVVGLPLPNKPARHD